MAEFSRYWCGGQFQAPRIIGNDNQSIDICLEGLCNKGERSE
jgi:hypothetical protein